MFLKFHTLGTNEEVIVNIDKANWITDSVNHKGTCIRFDEANMIMVRESFSDITNTIYLIDETRLYGGK